MAIILTGSTSDTITATTSSDIIYTGSGNDTVIENLTGVTGFDLIVGGSGIDTLKVILTQSMYNSIMQTNLVSAFNASATTWLQYFNFSSYNSLLGFSFNVITQGVEKLVFEILNPNTAPTANADDFGTVNDSANANVIQLGNVLSNDTDPDVGDTKHIVSATLSFNQDSYMTNNGVSEAPAVLVSAQEVQGIVDPNIVKEWTISDANGGTPAILTMYADGHLELVRNSGLDYLPQGTDSLLLFQINYTMADQSGSTSSSIAEFMVKGTDNQDVLVGTSGSDRLVAGIMNDQVYGGDGNDVLVGGSGSDLINGGNGSDISSYDDGRSIGVYVDLNLGQQFDNYDPINNPNGMNLEDTLVSIQNVVGTNFSDKIIGNSEDNFIKGGLGADYIDGGAGLNMVTYFADGRLVGVDVNLGSGVNTDGDTLINIQGVIGTNFDDHIVGDSADNQLDGKGGNNVLTGGAGADIFLINGLSNLPAYHTTITDLNLSESDAIQFYNVSDHGVAGLQDDLDAIFTHVTNDGVNTTFDDNAGHMVTLNGVYSSFTELFNFSILQSSGSAMLNQANAATQAVLNLF